MSASPQLMSCGHQLSGSQLEDLEDHHQINFFSISNLVSMARLDLHPGAISGGELRVRGDRTINICYRLRITVVCRLQLQRYPHDIQVSPWHIALTMVQPLDKTMWGMSMFKVCDIKRNLIQVRQLSTLRCLGYWQTFTERSPDSEFELTWSCQTSLTLTANTILRTKSLGHKQHQRKKIQIAMDDWPGLSTNLHERTHHPGNPTDPLLPQCGGDQPQGGGDGDPGHQPHQHVPGDQHDSWYEIYNSLVMLCDHIFIA